MLYNGFMHSDREKYPTRFYGRSLLFWVGLLACLPFLAWGFLLLPVFLFAPDIDMLVVVIFFSLFILLFAACVFQIRNRKRPILTICKEGLLIRSLGTPINIDPYLNIMFGFVPIVIIVFWRLITLQMFRKRTVRLRWENVDVMAGEDGLTIIDWFDKENNNDVGRRASLEHYTISYGVYSFRESVGRVGESVQFFLHNSAAREELPSWLNEDAF